MCRDAVCAVNWSEIRLCWRVLVLQKLSFGWRLQQSFGDSTSRSYSRLLELMLISSTTSFCHGRLSIAKASELFLIDQTHSSHVATSWVHIRRKHFLYENNEQFINEAWNYYKLLMMTMKLMSKRHHQFYINASLSLIRHLCPPSLRLLYDITGQLRWGGSPLFSCGIDAKGSRYRPRSSTLSTCSKRPVSQRLTVSQLIYLK